MKRRTEIDPTEPTTADEVTPPTPADESPPAAGETEPAYPSRGLDWWKAKAREHQAALESLTGERDRLQARVEALQQQQIETLVGQKMHDPGDFWRFGPPLAELLDENGDVDPDKVDAARTAIVQAHPYVAVSPAAPASMVTANDPIDRNPKPKRKFEDLLRTASRGA